jgi:adenosine/AMP kinase
MQLTTVRIEKPEAINSVLGQTHFIKSVEDIHEALVGTVPSIRFGLAFCEASGKRLVRRSGTDEGMIELARTNAEAIAAGHGLILFLGEGFYPLNVLNSLKLLPEVCHIFCATANPTEVILAEAEPGRGILGVVDGSSPRGVEGEDDITWRKGFLRQIGHKLWAVKEPSGLLRGLHEDGADDRLDIGAAAVRALHLGVLVVLGKGLLVVERLRALLATEFILRHGWSSVWARSPVPIDRSSSHRPRQVPGRSGITPHRLSQSTVRADHVSPGTERATGCSLLSRMPGTAPRRLRPGPVLCRLPGGSKYETGRSGQSVGLRV